MTRKPLGRGLGALLSVESTPQADDLFTVGIDLIDPNPVQPRLHFNEAKLEELAESIRSNGLVQPLVVRRIGARYQLVAGERRWRAARLAALQTVPVVVREIPDENLLELALIENIQREDLNAIEEANAYQKLIEKVGLTQESLAKRVGKDRSYITNYLRLLRLPSDIQQMVQEGLISTGHARTILGVPTAEAQRKLADRIVKEQLSVRDVERMVRMAAEPPSRSSNPRQPSDPNIAAAETKLRRRLGTKVTIQGDKARGKIVIEYYGPAELQRIYALLYDEQYNVNSVAAPS
jgi:ParB family chromosome partitioning protein